MQCFCVFDLATSVVFIRFNYPQPSEQANTVDDGGEAVAEDPDFLEGVV